MNRIILFGTFLSLVLMNDSYANDPKNWIPSMLYSDKYSLEEKNEVADGLICGTIGKLSNYILDFKRGKPRAVKTISDQVESATFSPDGKKVVSTSHDDTIKVWTLYDSKDEQALELLKEFESKLSLEQKVLLIILDENKRTAKKKFREKSEENAWMTTYYVDIPQIYNAIHTSFAGWPPCPPDEFDAFRYFGEMCIPEVFNTKNTYAKLPTALKRVVREYYHIRES